MKCLRIYLFAIFFLCFAGETAFAYTDQARLAEGAEADFIRIERLAVALPLYTPVREAPSLAELQQVLDSSASVSKRQVIAYETMVQNIARDTGKDLKAQNRHVAAKLFRDNAAKYADSYVLLTVANSSRPCFFFDVYQAGTNNLLYSYQLITDSDEPEDVKTYAMLVQKFYKTLDAAIQEETKNLEKAAKAPKAKVKDKKEKKDTK